MQRKPLIACVLAASCLTSVLGPANIYAASAAHLPAAATAAAQRQSPAEEIHKVVVKLEKDGKPLKDKNVALFVI